jgi:atypical dual specificity phosphatase
MHIPNLKVQTWIRPTDGTILINLSDPVNEKYFGDEPYKNADAKLHCQIRLAELVLDECLNEIVTNAWGRTLPRRFPDNPEVDIRLYVAEKKFEIGQIVHNHFVTIGYDEQHIGSGASRHKEKEITESTLRNAELPQSLEGLNLSWVIAEKLAGCASPSDDYDLLFLKKQSISLIVRLAEDREAEVTSEQIKKIGLKDIHEPIPDKTAPSPSQIKKIVDGVKDALDKGEKVAVSCKAGKGRTGTILTCILVSLGYKLHEAIDQVQATRGQNKAWETDEQYHAILGFTETIRSGSKMQDGV